MKFVALALAVLLAVGSQAASLQADAPSQLAHIRSVADIYMTQVKEGAIKALEQLDDTPYQELKATLVQRLETLHAQIKTLQTSVSPMTDSVVSTVSDATADFRAKLTADIEQLKTELEPKRAKLMEVIEKHLEEYRTHMEPIIQEYHAKHTADMEALRAKMEPIVAELRQKMSTNIDETRAALMPMVEAVRTKLVERLENLKEMATPYVDEYKEQLKTAYGQAQSFKTDDLAALREKIAPLAEDIKAKFSAMFALIAETFTKN
ncbi:apolipoprotein A-I-like [Melanotaenia boesemani]|uniref:apolipoprotein A-I-like n=1 Tax=Melanotaenia boesemani TaxID=1250792 RepID=UPI001C059E2F|nr:apolipoprotein A-I-like [Melanotaenia boesemani]